MDYFSSIPLDWIIIFAVAILLTIDSIRTGSARGVALALALPPALLINSFFYSAKFLSPLSSAISAELSQAIVFIAVMVAAYFLVRRMMSEYGHRGNSLMQAIICGVATTSLLVVIWLEVPALQSIWNFGTQTNVIFGDAYKFWWFIVSLFALAYART